MQQLPLGELQVTITNSFTACFSASSKTCHNKRENLTDIFFFRHKMKFSRHECNAWNSALSSVVRTDLSVQWWLHWLQERYLKFTSKLLKARSNPETSSVVSICLAVNSLMLYWPRSLEQTSFINTFSRFRNIHRICTLLLSCMGRLDFKKCMESVTSGHAHVNEVFENYLHHFFLH